MVDLRYHLITMQSKLTVENIIQNWPLELLNGHLHFTIALSGGVDSVVLLDIFSKISKIKPIRLSAIHVNHNISPNSSHWAEFCQNLCNKYNIKLETASIKVTKIGGEGLENSARKARYKEFYNLRSDVIILAHHKDDQIETMLSQIMRGSSITNCAGMLSISQKNNKIFWRPLLDIDKSEIVKYVEENSLTNIEDESNSDNQYLRNFIRNDIMPQLISYDKNIINKLSQLVNNFSESVKLHEDLARIDLNNLSENLTIDKSEFLKLAEHRQINLLNYLIKNNEIPLTSQKSLREFCRQLHSKQNPQITLKLSNTHKLVADKKYIQIQQSDS